MMAQDPLRILLKRIQRSFASPPARRAGTSAWYPPAAEVLEARSLLSVVTATFSAGSLTLTGDVGNHDLTVFRNNATGLVRVQGFNGTQISYGGQTRQFHEFALNSNLTIDLEKGRDDFVGIDGRGFLLTGMLTARLGGGHNAFTAGDLTAISGVEITGGNLVDDVSFSFLKTSQVRICTGGTFDSVTIWSSRIGESLILSTGDGSDSILVEDSEFGGVLQLDTGSGGESDNVQLVGDTVKGPALIATGGGNDRVGIANGNVPGGAQVLTGDGDDSVEFRDTTIGALLTVLTGNGRDTVELKGTGTSMTTIHGPATVDTGSGDDQIVIVRGRFNSSVLLSMGYDNASNTISIDDSAFHSGIAALTFGANNSIKIERNAGFTGQTTFNGPVMLALYGASGRIEIGDTGFPFNKTRFGSSVLLVGGNPRAVVRYALPSTTFLFPPTLINAVLVT